jgi:2-deoxy-D-gluconate 3-dehydrogenase
MRDWFSLAGKMALVTGAGRGMGRAIAVALADAGADVALASRSEAELAETAALVEATGRKAVMIVVDLRPRGEAARTVQRAAAELGHLDIVVTSSGTQIRKPIFEIVEDDWDTVVDLNLKARFFLARAAAQQMRDQNQGGAIIHIASLSTFIAIPNVGPYAASNGGIGSMVRVQAIEWAKYNIRVNGIAPGTIVTKQTEALLANPEMLASRLEKIPLNRLGEPEDVAGSAIFLASKAAAYITGHILLVDGGWLASGGGLKG